MGKSNISYYLILGVIVLGLACNDLSVENLNEPDSDRVYSSRAEMETLASGLYATWYTQSYGASFHEGTPAHMFAGAADNITSSWGSYGIRDASMEPRVAWDNDPYYGYEYVSRVFFENMYSILSSVSDILGEINEGNDFGEDTPMMEAWCKFVQGLALGNIALTFDQGIIATEETPIDELINPELVKPEEIAAKALSIFDEVITISDANAFSFPGSYINGIDIDNVLLSELANSYAARLMAYMPRNAEENSQVDWARVKNYAQHGITNDFNILMDDIVWANDMKWIIAYPGWGRSDMRVVNMMYPEDLGGYPAHNRNGLDFDAPDSVTVVQSEAIDNRILTDFEHLSSNSFRPDRGLYYFSSFRQSRYDEYFSFWNTSIPEIMLEELLLIEA